MLLYTAQVISQQLSGPVLLPVPMYSKSDTQISLVSIARRL
jgi:hypothetical protein